MSTTPKPKASLGTTKEDTPGVLTRAHLMYTAILAAIGTFPSPTVTMVAFLALIQALETAQQAAATRAKGLAAVRDSKRDALWSAMLSLRAYVQSIADLASHTDAITVIQSAGLLVAAVGDHHKPILQAKLTTSQGVVDLYANATQLVGPANRHKKTYFSWQWSGDGGKTWSTATTTAYASTQVVGLLPMTQYLFRVAVTVAKTTGEWSDTVGLLVH